MDKKTLPELATLVRWDPSSGTGYLEVKAAPGAPRTEFFGVMDDGAVKIRVAAKPEHGKANAALLEFLKKNLGVSGAEVISGAGASRKIVRFRR